MGGSAGAVRVHRAEREARTARGAMVVEVICMVWGWAGGVVAGLRWWRDVLR